MRPRWFKKARWFTVEWYDRKAFFLSFSPGNFEVQVNRWRPTKGADADAATTAAVNARIDARIKDDILNYLQKDLP